jgi:phosphoribosylamine--glycine ligase
VRGGGELYATLGNTNPGILALAKAHAILKDTDASGIAKQAKAWGVELAVVGPDGALAAGVTDALQREGIPVAAPTQRAAQIEWDKAFMRDLLERHDVPGRVKYQTFDSLDGMREYADALGAVAVKPIGLTGGKGVKVTGDHLRSTDDALAYAKEIFETGTGGSRVIVEEKIEGEEFSLMAFCDGRDCVPLPAVQDHKRAFEGDTGPNTGGMGSYSGEGGLLPFLTQGEHDESLRILRAILAALAKEDRPFVGTIYGQFMLSRTGPRVIEINARFGDPEAMNVLTLLESNYVDILRAMAEGRLDASLVRASRAATVCKYVVPEGYGAKPMANEPVEVDEPAIRAAGATAYYAAVNLVEGKAGARVKATTTTSRAVGLVATGATIAEANAKVDAALAHVTGPHLVHRRDIGTAPLLERRVETMRRIRGA